MMDRSLWVDLTLKDLGLLPNEKTWGVGAFRPPPPFISANREVKKLIIQGPNILYRDEYFVKAFWLQLHELIKVTKKIGIFQAEILFGFDLKFSV